MPDLELTAASVVGRDPGNVFYDFTIDRGSLSGISTGDAVITEMGVWCALSSCSCPFRWW